MILTLRTGSGRSLSESLGSRVRDQREFQKLESPPDHLPDKSLRDQRQTSSSQRVMKEVEPKVYSSDQVLCSGHEREKNRMYDIVGHISSFEDTALCCFSLSVPRHFHVYRKCCDIFYPLVPQRSLRGQTKVQQR